MKTILIQNTILIKNTIWKNFDHFYINDQKSYLQIEEEIDNNIVQ